MVVNIQEKITQIKIKSLLGVTITRVCTTCQGCSRLVALFGIILVRGSRLLTSEGRFGQASQLATDDVDVVQMGFLLRFLFCSMNISSIPCLKRFHSLFSTCSTFSTHLSSVLSVFPQTKRPPYLHFLLYFHLLCVIYVYCSAPSSKFQLFA